MCVCAAAAAPPPQQSPPPPPPKPPPSPVTDDEHHDVQALSARAAGLDRAGRVERERETKTQQRTAMVTTKEGDRGLLSLCVDLAGRSETTTTTTTSVIGLSTRNRSRSKSSNSAFSTHVAVVDHCHRGHRAEPNIKLPVSAFVFRRRRRTPL